MTLRKLNSRNIFGCSDSASDEIIECVLDGRYDKPVVYHLAEGDQLIIANANGFDDYFGDDEDIHDAFRDACEYADLPSECVDVQAYMNVFCAARNAGEISEEECEAISERCEEQYWVEENKAVEFEDEQDELLDEYINVAWNGIRCMVLEKVAQEPPSPFDPNRFYPPVSFEGDSCLLIYHDPVFEGNLSHPPYFTDDKTGKVYVDQSVARHYQDAGDWVTLRTLLDS